MRTHSLLLRLANLDSDEKAISLRQAALPHPDLVLPSRTFRLNGLAWHAAELEILVEWLDDSAAQQRDLSEIRVGT